MFCESELEKKKLYSNQLQIPDQKSFRKIDNNVSISQKIDRHQQKSEIEKLEHN